MKNVKNIILGMVFVAVAMASIDTVAKEAAIDCNVAFTICDNHAPDDYAHFLECMSDNGC